MGVSPQEREAGAAAGAEGAAQGEPADAGGSARDVRDVREVVGRRGHDEAEDETTAEDEEH